MDGPGCESVGGRRVCLRRLQAEDRPLLQDFLAQIDPYDLQMRFFAGFRSVPPTLLDFLMRIDREHRTVLVTIDDRSRSEEHTSELQSHSDLVCRLLLEKKKKKIK